MGQADTTTGTQVAVPEQSLMEVVTERPLLPAKILSPLLA